MNAPPEFQNGFAPWRIRLVASAVLAAVAIAGALAHGDEPAQDRLERGDGAKAEGRVLFDPDAGFRFQTVDGAGVSASSPPLATGDVVVFPSTRPAAAVPPPVQAALGRSGRISGTLRSISADAVRLSVPWSPDEVVLRRPGVQALFQRRGEAQVLADGFDALDPAVWTVAGRPEVVDEAGESILALPSTGASIERRFDEPIDAGRIDLTFRDDGVVHPDRSWRIVLTFRGSGAPAPMRVQLGWTEESLAVETPEGPALAVQRLVRTAAWRRLSIRFDADHTELAVDGKTLAHGRATAGSLESIQIEAVGAAVEQGEPDPPRAFLGAVHVARFAQPPSSLEIDPTQDEARLLIGDQLFGAIGEGGRDRVVMQVDDRPVVLDWRELTGLYFRRVPATGASVAGALVNVEWNPGGDDPDHPIDFAEGAVVSFDDRMLVLETPYAGVLRIPRGRLSRLHALEPGLRLVIDPCAHHLGDEVSITPPLLDPPLPEGGVLEIPFDVPEDAPVVGSPFVVLDVVGVVGEATGLPFSEFIRRDELKTFLAIDGRRVDYINRYITGSNDEPERIRIPIPADVLRPGPHVLRLEQTGTEKDPGWYDDLGVLGAAVEFTPTPP